MTDQTFAQLGAPEPILRAVSQQGYETPTPIQCQAIPHLIAGRDLLGIAQTGTGKTAAFALPILDFLAADPQPPVARRPSVLVLTLTRELATQIGESFRVYGANTPVSHTVIFGGVPQGRQVRAMARGVDVLATPGRLIDLMDQRHIDLCDIEVFVLDEADRMLDMGFLPAVRKVIRALPEDRQSVLFSATMPPDIVALTKAILRDPVRVEVTPQASTAERVDQRVLFVEKADKRKLLGEVLRDTSIERALVFTRTKHGADRVATHLRRLDVKVAAIHGDKSQGQRERALDGFRNGSVRVLVATDIAARGIDVPGISHVINFDLPNVPESYVHRIGRTARAGRGGTAISFCASDEHEHLRDIEKTIRQSVPRVEDHPYRSGTPFRSAAPEPKGKSQRHRKPNRNEAKAPAARRAKRGRSSRQRARSA